MAQPEYDNKPSITVLKSHELLHIFGYLYREDLLQCRLVCPYWYELIKDDSQSIDKFRFEVTFSSSTVVCTDEPPFSIMDKSKIKLKRITIREDFLEPGNSIAAVEANRSKLSALSNILTDIKAEETVTEMTIHTRDNEPRTSALLLPMIMKMKNLNILRFTLSAFVHCLEKLSQLCVEEKCMNVEHIQIIHTDFKRLTSNDFYNLLKICPNIKRVDVKSTDAMLLDERIVQDHARLIKSIEKFESYTIMDLDVFRDTSLNHISYECSADDAEDVSNIHEFLTAHPELETLSLKLLNGPGNFFTGPLAQLTDLDMNIKQYLTSKQKVADWKLGNILRWTPNLMKLAVLYKGSIEHQFGHKVIEMKNLIDVTLTRFSLDCEMCCGTILKSIIHVKSLKLARLNNYLSLPQLILIATNLKQLERLELTFDDSVELQNHFAWWPAMPKLKILAVNRVGYLTNKDIKNLQSTCPMLEVLKFYSLRGSNMDRLLKETFESFPSIKAITFRGGRCEGISELDYIKDNVGWRLQELDISANIQPSAIIKLFQNNNFLQIIRCKYGALVVTRRIYYESEILKAYNLDEIEQPLRNRQRLHLYEDYSSDSETSDSEESTSGESDTD